MARRRGWRFGTLVIITAVAVGAPATVVAALAPSDGARAVVEADKKPKKRKKNAKTDAAATAKRMPTDACTLLTPADVSVLVPNVSPGEPDDQSAGGVSQLSCYWANEPTATSSPSSVTLTLTELDGLSRRLAQETVERGEGKAIPGLGDGARVTTMGIGSAVQVVVGDVLMTLDFSAIGGGEREADVITLARAAAGRL